MRSKIKILLGLLLFLITAAAARIPLSYVEAQSASASDFQMKGDTLVKYTGTASAVSIPTSVKNIGREAFAGHTELKKVDIPGYVETIGYNAFNGCSSLEQILIPDTVTEIGNGAFSGCSSLTSITLGKKFRKLGNGVFADCTSLSEVKLSKDNEEFSYDSGVIYSKDKSVLYAMLPGYKNQVYKMPSSVKQVKNNAFWGCMNLTKAEIGSSVEEIPDYAFANCRNLEKVILPYSLHRIGLKAFADCINLGDMEIPVSVAVIHDTAFDGCPGLNIIAEEGSKAAEYDARRDKSNVAQYEYQDIVPEGSEGTEDDGEAAPADSGTDNAATLGESRIIGGNAVVFIDNNRSKVLSGNEKPASGDGTAYSQIMETGRATDSFPKYTIVNNEVIASQAYYGNGEMTEYNMPETIKSIGDFAFARTGLSSVIIPEGVTRIGYGAFYHCDELASVTIPSSVTEIEPAAFDKTKWMDSLLENRTSPFTVVGDGILIAYAGMGGKVEVPEGVKQIGAEVFKGNTRITSVSLPDSLSAIGEDAFLGCSNLISVSGGSNLIKIKDRAFEGCPISTIKIPSSVKEIGLKAYDISGTGKEDGTKIAVFLGKKLPGVSFEKTATRMTNESYRDAAFKDVRIAIVDDSINSGDIKDTVLDYDKGGFRGFVCSVAQAAKGETPGQLRIKFCVMQEEDVEENTVPETVIVYGKPYIIINPEDAVVYASENREASGDEEGTVAVEISSSTMPSSASATARLDGIKKDYILRITDNSSVGNMISTAYRRVTGGSRMTSLQVYDMALYDGETMIPISRLGKQQMTVIVPKPKGILEEGLQVVCLDEDGQLEKVESRLVTVNGETCVQFTAEHFSAYGFYN